MAATSRLLLIGTGIGDINLTVRERRYWIYVFRTLLLVLFVVVFAPGNVLAATKNYACVTRTTPLRGDASSDSPVYGYLNKGKVVEYLGKSKNHYKIKYRNTYAYLSTKDTVVGDKLESYVRQHPDLFKKRARR